MLTEVDIERIMARSRMFYEVIADSNMPVRDENELLEALDLEFLEAESAGL